jgi:DNA-binding NarL/FixJ family response regulator
MSKTTIVVIDDHPIFRQGVVDTLSLEPDFFVIGEAASGEEGLKLVRARRPQVAVVDVNLPGINGQQVTRQIAAEKLSTRVILLTAYDDEEQKIHAMRGGAAAYCVKDVQPEILVNIVRAVLAGNYVVGDNVFDLAK